MKNLYFILMFVLSTFGFGQNAGFFGSPLSSVIYNDGSAKDQEANVFNGTNLGVITNLELNGARIQTFKNGGADVTGAFIHYRVFEQGTTTAPAFTVQSITFAANLGGGNQRWEQSNLNIDLLSGLTEGNYIFEVFFRITVTGCCGGEVFQSNSGGNYSANFTIPYVSDQTGNWSAGSTWTNGNVPVSGADVIIGSNHVVFLDQDANVSSLNLTSSPISILSFDGGGRTLEIQDGGIIEDDQGFAAGNGTVSFLGSGSVTSTFTTIFNNVDIAGGVDFGSNSEIDGELTIESGGFVVNLPPRYSSNSTLIYSDDGNPYGRGLEWSSLTGRGYPNNVIIRDNTTLNLGANGGAGTRRQCRGNLTVEAGSALTLAGPNMTQSLTVLGNYINNGTTTLSSSIGGDLVLRGNFDDDGIFTANGRAVFFEGGNTQNITSATNPLEIDVMRINKTGGEVVMGQNLLVDETADPLDFSSATSHLNLSGHTLTIGKAGVTSNVTMASGSEIRGSTTSGLVILGNGDLGTINLGSGATATLGNLDINRGAGGSVTIDSDLIIETTGNISAGNILEVTGNITNNGNITFESDATGSGQLDTFTGTLSGSGNVTVERFIPVKRAYRLLASPVTTTDFIFENWQENGIYPTSPNGAGTHITGIQGTVGQADASTGLDQTASGNSSMFTFDNTNNNGGAQTDDWTPIQNTKTTKLEAGEPYLTFVRGDRSTNLAINNAPASVTTLSAAGDLHTGPLSPTLSSTHEHYSLVANPYQAIVDFNLVDRDDLTDFIYVWDASIGGANGNGGYVSVELSTGSTQEINPPGPTTSDASQYIAPGMAFFVENLESGSLDITLPFNPSLTFEEVDKATSQSEVTIFNTYPHFYINSRLYNTADLQNGNTESDAIGLRFNDNYTTAGSSEDATKLFNPGENYAIVNNGLRSIDKQGLPVIDHEIDLSITNYQDTNYSLTFMMENKPTGLGVFIVDNYLNTQTELTESAVYDFTVDANVSGSIAENRFRLIFDNTTLGVDDNTFGSDFRVFPNPSTDAQFSISTPGIIGEVKVEMTNLLGQNVYAKELSITGTQVDVNATGLSSGVYVVKLTQGNQSFSTKLIVE